MIILMYYDIDIDTMWKKYRDTDIYTHQIIDTSYCVDTSYGLKVRCK